MAKTEPASRVVVCDAGPLIHLDELGCFDLLSEFAVLVPAEVWSEVMQHRPAALAASSVQLNKSDVTDILPNELAAVSRLFALHSGELQALHLAMREGADMLLTDDTAARLAARQLQVPVHGSLGILVRSIRRGQRTAAQVVDLLRKLPELSSLHIKRSLLEEVIRSVQGQ